MAATILFKTGESVSLPISGLGSSNITVDWGNGIPLSYINGQDVSGTTVGPIIVSTLAGKRAEPGYPDGGYVDGSGAIARFYSPYDVAVDSNGNIYVADTGNNMIRKVTSNGFVSTIVGVNQPKGVAFDICGNLYITETGSHKILKMTPGGSLTTLAGTGSPGFARPGSPESIQMRVMQSFRRSALKTENCMALRQDRKFLYLTPQIVRQY